MSKGLPIIIAILFVLVIQQANAQTPSMSFSNLRMVDSFGNDISPTVGESAHFSAIIKNNQEISQPYVYRVLINELQYDEFIIGELEPGQQVNVGKGPITILPGKYNVQAFIYESINYKKLLAPPLTFQIDLSLQLKPVKTNHYSHDLEFFSTSKIANQNFISSHNRINFDVSGPSGTPGSLVVKIPGILIGGNLRGFLDGQQISPSNFYSFYNVEQKSHYVTMKYSHSDHKLGIAGDCSGTVSFTASGYNFLHNWKDCEVRDDKMNTLLVMVQDFNDRTPTNHATFTALFESSTEPEVSKSVEYISDTYSINLMTGELRNNNPHGTNYAMKFNLKDFNNNPVDEWTIPKSQFVVVPEFDLIVILISMVLLFGIVIFMHKKLLPIKGINHQITFG